MFLVYIRMCIAVVWFNHRAIYVGILTSGCFAPSNVFFQIPINVGVVLHKFHYAVFLAVMVMNQRNHNPESMNWYV